MRTKWAFVKLAAGGAMAAAGSAAVAGGILYATQLPSFCNIANCSTYTVGGSLIAASGGVVLAFAVGMIVVAVQRLTAVHL